MDSDMSGDFAKPEAKSLPALIIGFLFPQVLLSQGVSPGNIRWLNGFTESEEAWLADIVSEVGLRWVMAWMAMMIGTSMTANIIGLFGLGLSYFITIFLWTFEFYCLKKIARRHKQRIAE